MATSITSDIFHGYSCTPCKDDGENREAEVYCVNCREYFCKKCLRYHNRVAGAREHQLLGKDEFQQVMTPSTNSGIPDLPTERCLRHHGKLVDMFCGDHDEVGCNTCLSLKHRHCKDIFYIPDIAKSRVTKKSVKTIQDALTSLQHKTTDMKDRRVENQARIVNEKDSYLDKVIERRKEIDKHLDEIQNVQTKNIIDKFHEFHSKLGNDIKSCDQTISLIDQSQQSISTSDSTHNTSQTFIHMKQAEHILTKADKDLKEIDKNMNDSLCLQYKTDTDIMDVLSSRDLFGSLHAGIPTPVDVEFVEDINIKFDSDTKLCDCNDLCQLPDGTIIVTDWSNKNIKSLAYDKTYKLNDSLIISNRPYGVCCITDSDIAVTVPGDKRVEVISVKPKMVIKSSIKVDYRCHGIEYNDGKLYIGHCSDKQLKVFDLRGNCLQTFYTDQKCQALLSHPRHLCIIPDKQQIAVADKYKGLVVIDMSGQLVTEYTYTNRRSTYGVCIDERGNLIVADLDSRQIVTVAVDKTCRTLLTNMDEHPQAVFFDKQTKRLIVTHCYCNFMKVFTLKYAFSSARLHLHKQPMVQDLLKRR